MKLTAEMINYENVSNAINEFIAQLITIVAESKSPLIDNIINHFNAQDVYSSKKIILTQKLAILMYDALNAEFFENKLDVIPVYCWREDAIREELERRHSEDDEFEIPKVFYGAHSVMIDNDFATMKRGDELLLHDDIIMMNCDKINHTSFIFCLACICHEMIHYYDRLYGEYQNAANYSIVTKNRINMHNTLTFENKLAEANAMNLNVISSIPNGVSVQTLDNNAIDLLWKAAEQHEQQYLHETEISNINIGGITLVDRYHGAITTF